MAPSGNKLELKPVNPPPRGAMPPPPPPGSAPGVSPAYQVEVIIARGTIGTIQVVGGGGGTLNRSQLISFYGGANNPFQVAKLQGAKAPVGWTDKDMEEIDNVNDPATATYLAQYCGETFFQVWFPSNRYKKSITMRLLSLMDKAIPLQPVREDYSPDPNFKSGLLSKSGTPLNPLPGRRINLFGEGESPGFEDYS